MIQQQPSIVFMGVAGCGKSSLGVAVARQMALDVIEGDDHHSPGNLAKMRGGVALTDDDRDGWLTTLAQALQAQPSGVVLTCSALKRVYRDRLRNANPGLQFVYLDITRDQALVRVTERAAAHFFSTSLVDSQFTTLEVPTGEHGVLRVDATAPLAQLQAEVCAWLALQNETIKERA